MDWKNHENDYILLQREVIMGALRKTSSAFTRILTAYDGDSFNYSPKDRHEKFIEDIRKGPHKDFESFNKDMKAALNQLSGLIEDVRRK